MPIASIIESLALIVASRVVTIGYSLTGKTTAC